MEIIAKYIKAIGAVIAIVAGVLTIYFSLHKEQVSLEIKTMSAQLLTTQTSTDELSVQYFYKDTIPVRNLWQVQYVIRNIGDATLVGVGEQKQLLSTNLPFIIENKEYIYSIAITQSNNEAFLAGNQICFKQWRSGEYIEITALIENKEEPRLIINERDIIGGNVVYQTYTPDIQDEKTVIIDFLPKGFKTTLMIIYIIIVCVLYLGMIISWIKEKQIKDKCVAFCILLFVIIPILWMI